jgi:hypothetical protein
MCGQQSTAGGDGGVNEVIIRIQAGGTVSVEACKDGVTSFKAITPDSLIACLQKSLLRGVVSSGLLPRECISFTAHDNGSRDIYILHPESSADITYYGSPYPNFPLPKLVFGFHLTGEGRISRSRLGVVANESFLKPTTPLFVYPFGNVSGTNICTGNNVLPKCQSLYTLTSLPYHILGMDNNNDHFSPSNNRLGLEMRDLLALLRDKPPEYYYSDVLIPGSLTLGDFINGKEQ